VVGCPYGAAHPNLTVKDKHAFKCDLCIDRLEIGLKPACVEACPNRALIYDETMEKSEEVHAR
jgi:carbon-monoxide dehydrogenase iron sulfur subunit